MTVRLSNDFSLSLLRSDFLHVETLEQTNNIRSKGREKLLSSSLRKQTTRLIGIDDLFYHVFAFTRCATVIDG